MSLAITLVAAVLICIVGSVAYHQGKKQSDGCNGHHWGEPRRPDAEGVSRVEREDSGLPREVTHNPRKHLETDIHYGQVVLSGKAIKTCQDCGAKKTTNITIGTLPTEVFEDGWDVVPSDAYELDDDFGGSDWVVEQ
jgi:hypothetical protein